MAGAAPRLVRLDLSFNLISERGATALAALLRGRSAVLRELNLSGNKQLGHQGIAAIAEVLRANTSLTSLALCETGLSDRDLAEIGTTLRFNATLQRLFLAGHHGTDAGAAALASGLTSNAALAVLDLHGHGVRVFSVGQIGDAGAEALGRALETNRSLRSLDLGGNRIGGNGVAALAKAFECGSPLSVLHLDRNRVGVDGCRALGLALTCTWCKLAELDLTGNSLQDQGVAFLAVGLGASKMERLLLRNTELSAAGMSALCDALVKCGTVRRLDVSDNSLGDLGVFPIAQLLRSGASLAELDLTATGVGAVGMKDLCSSLVTRPTDSLTKLNLGLNNVDDEFFAAVSAMVDANRSLLFLDLRAPRISNVGAMQLANAMQNNYTLHTIILSSGLRPNHEGWPTALWQLPKIRQMLDRNLAARRRRLWRILRGAAHVIFAYIRFREEYYLPQGIGAQAAKRHFEESAMRQRAAMRVV
mmetsp:Transcript_6979/g.19650  ORF Transcript_6979/g.19650 Transcript_6979/m.19650 type:complete len:476 (+) Transcript_6979:79-1506(+)